MLKKTVESSLPLTSDPARVKENDKDVHGMANSTGNEFEKIPNSTSGNQFISLHIMCNPTINIFSYTWSIMFVFIFFSWNHGR